MTTPNGVINYYQTHIIVSWLTNAPHAPLSVPYKDLTGLSLFHGEGPAFPPTHLFSSSFDEDDVDLYLDPLDCSGALEYDDD